MQAASDGPKRPGRRRPRLLTWRVHACLLGFAVAWWMWLSWGFAWDATPAELANPGTAPRFPGGWVGRYVRVRAGGVSRTWYAIERLNELQDGATWSDYVHSARTSAPAAAATQYWLVDIHDPGAWYGVYALVEDSGGGPRLPIRGRVTVERLSYRPGSTGKGGGLPRSPRVVVDTTEGRVNGMVLIGLVIAFWSSVFLQLFIVEQVRARRRYETEKAERKSHADRA